MSRQQISVAVAVLIAIGAVVYWVPIPIIGALLFGWASFLQRVLPSIEVRLDGLGIFVLTFVFAVACFHYVITWLVREFNKTRSTDQAIRWSRKSSFFAMVMLAMFFVIGIAMTGVTHQVGWLITSPEPMYVSKVQTRADSDLSTYRVGAVADHHDRSWWFNVLTFVNYVQPEIDSAHPWNSPPNADAFRTIVFDALCPSQGNPIWSPDGFGLSHKAGNPEVFQGHSLRLGDFDDLGETVFVGEVNAAFSPWGDPHGTRSLELGIQNDWSGARRGDVGFGSAHGGGALMLMGDGSTRFVNDRIDAAVLEQLGRRSK